jgi:peptidoglycan/xylan/chitin deacetylase (PgdA/CDA1 family)
LARWPDLFVGSSLPVLCYHNVGGNGVPRALFRRQMAWLAGHGYRTLGLSELTAVLAGHRPIGRAVLLTFDDGFRDLFTFIGPVLAGHGFTGLAFVITDRLRPEGEPGLDGEIIADQAHAGFIDRGERSAWLSAEELKKLTAQGLFEVGSHTARHAMRPLGPARPGPVPGHWAYGPWRGAMSAPELAPELAGPLWRAADGRPETVQEFYERAVETLTQSRRELASVTGTEVASLAWPWGRYHPVAVEAARQAGFELVFSLARGPLVPGADACRLPRLEVRRGRGMGWFVSRLKIYGNARLARWYSAGRM